MAIVTNVFKEIVDVNPGKQFIFLQFVKDKLGKTAPMPAAQGHLLIGNAQVRKKYGCRANRQFPSSCLSPFQSESKCEVFMMVISSTLHINEN